MAYNPVVAERVRDALRGKGLVEEKRLMGGLCFMVNDKLCICVNQQEILCRIGEANQAEALLRPGTHIMVWRGRPTIGYVFVAPEAFDAEEDFKYWIALALAYNLEVNAKPVRKAPKRATQS